MILKLLKYELKSTMRIFLIIFGVIMLLALTSGAGLILGNEVVRNLGITATSFAVLPIMIIFIYTIIQRYSTNLYSDEGYLMFTLPVSSWEIVVTKIISAIIWSIATAVVCIIAATTAFFMASIASKEYSDFSRFFMYLIDKIRDMGYNWVILSCFSIFASFLNFLMLIYLSISIGNLSFINRANAFISVVIFFAIYMIESKIGVVIVTGSTGNMASFDELMYSMIILKEMIFNIVGFAIAFAGTVYITSKKVHLK